MKRVFDSNSNQLKEALNGLIDDLTESGAADIGGSVDGMTGQNVEALIEELKGITDDTTADVEEMAGKLLPDGDGSVFLANDGTWKLPSVGASANGVAAGGAVGALYVKKSEKVYDGEWKSPADLDLMKTTTYDTDSDGIVDNSEKLEGHTAAYFATADHTHSYAAPSQAKTVTLAVASWTGEEAPFTQTVTVEGMTANANVVVSPAPASLMAYGAAQVRCTAQAAGSLTFACETAPEESLTVNVLIVG